MQTALLVAFETSEFFAELLLSESIEFAVAGGYEGIVAGGLSVNVIKKYNKKLENTDFMRASVLSLAFFRYNLMTLGLSMRTGVSTQLPYASRCLRLMIITSSLRSTLCLLN